MYKLLAFEHPWEATDTTGLAALAHDQRPATNILKYRPDLDPTIAAIVMKCLEADPEKRTKSAKAILQVIKDLKTDVAK